MRGIAGTEHKEYSISWPDKKAVRRLGVGQRLMERKVRESEEEAKIDGQQMQLLCAQQNLPWEEVGPCAG